MSKPQTAGVATVLVVDDVPEIRRFVRRVLEPQGFQILEAGDGVEALEVARQSGRSIDLVLTDLIMPRLNGVALADELAQVRPQTPVLYMSGYVESGLFAARRPDAILLKKPFSPDRLVSAITRLLKLGDDYV